MERGGEQTELAAVVVAHRRAGEPHDEVTVETLRLVRGVQPDLELTVRTEPELRGTDERRTAREVDVSGDELRHLDGAGRWHRLAPVCLQRGVLVGEEEVHERLRGSSIRGTTTRCHHDKSFGARSRGAPNVFGTGSLQALGTGTPSK